MIKERIKNTLNSYAKVIENYFFMTTLQVISTLFGILIYPYVIRMLGAESYGIYVFALSITSYFISFITFGFNYPAMKSIVDNKDDIEKKSLIVSSVFTAKIYLSVIASLIFAILILTIPILNQNKFIFIVVYLQIICDIIYPVWFFQAIQKMRIVTIINLIFRALSIPLIFIFVKNAADNLVFSLIVTLSLVGAALSAAIYMNKVEYINIKFQKFRDIKQYFKDAYPFFGAAAVANIKYESVTILIASFLGLREVALYDLANKIITIPRVFTQSIIGSLFPKIVEDFNKKTIQKILRYEALLGIIIIVLIIIFGKWLVVLFGGAEMIETYPILIVLSFTILSWLIIGSYNSFLYVPLKKYNLVTKNQFFSFFSFCALSIVAIAFYRNVLFITLAFALSSISEVFYSRFLIYKHKLLK